MMNWLIGVALAVFYCPGGYPIFSPRKKGSPIRPDEIAMETGTTSDNNQPMHAVRLSGK